MSTRKDIRRRIRKQRRALSPEQRLDFALEFANLFTHNKIYKTSHRIACYLAHDGELDLFPLIETAWRHNKQVYLPVLQAPFTQRILFARYEKDTALVSNKFGIAEPAIAARDRIKPQSLDIILAPLVAFDRSGHRIGMGGGYYDRSLGFLKLRQHWHRPALIGCGFHFQEVAQLEAEAWDVGLSAVCTNQEFISV
ncbi:MAG: 5-formyltetrahydrofolate cyclo-ligase [Thiohalomonadales bacterium]